MAIQITTQPTNPPHNAYNNSVIEFGVDAGVPVTATISAGGYNFEISADENGLFYFNLKSIVSVLINQDHFSDDILVNDPAFFLFDDPNLFLELELNILIRLEDDSEVTETFIFSYLKSVHQLIRKPFQNSELKILAPYANDVCHLSYFEGYPFDISIYSDVGRSITINSLRTGLSHNLNLSKGVNRLFISNGENDNLGFESQLPLYLGVNELEFRIGVNKYFTLFLDKKESECGQLVKFFNQEGGWSYFRFLDLYVEKTKSDTIERINTDFENLDNTNYNFTISGKQSEKSRRLSSGIINKYEKELIEQIVTSPKVFLYTNALHQPFEKNDFVGVEISGGSYNSGNKYRQSNFFISIELPKTYIQTL